MAKKTNVEKFVEKTEDLIESYPFLYVELARTRVTGWCAIIRIKPSHPERLAFGQAETAEEACEQALKELGS